MLVVLHRSGDQQAPAILRVLQQSSPSLVGECLRRRQDRQLRRAQRLNLVFGDRVGGEVIVISQRPHSFSLSFQLQILNDGELRRLRSHNGNRRLYWTPQMRTQSLRESRIVAQQRRLWLFRRIRAHRPNRRLIILRHVGIRVPKPLNRPRTLNERRRNLPLQERRLILRCPACNLVESQFPLQSGFLNQQSFPRHLGHHRIPQRIIHLPP